MRQHTFSSNRLRLAPTALLLLLLLLLLTGTKVLAYWYKSTCRN
jgi:hypothetical protein